MSPQELIRVIEGTIVVAGVFAIFYTVFRDKTTKEVIRQQNQLIQTQKERLEILEGQHIENARAIGKLQGEVNAYKKIPLEKIAKSIESIAKTNGQILKAVKENK